MSRSFTHSTSPNQEWIGRYEFTAAQLKTIQEVITLARAVPLIFKEW